MTRHAAHCSVRGLLRSVHVVQDHSALLGKEGVGKLALDTVVLGLGLGYGPELSRCEVAEEGRLDSFET